MSQQALFDEIDKFIDAKDPSSIATDPQMRQELFGTLVNKVTEDWEAYLKFHQSTLEALSQDIDLSKFTTVSTQMQELCARLIFELEDVDKHQFSPESLFKAKTTFLELRFQIDSFKQYIEKELNP